jgi:hypothetical protein
MMRAPMICPECARLALKSTMRETEWKTFAACGTPVVFYDENGFGHIHDSATTISHLECSNGHAVVATENRPCTLNGCDWTSRTLSLKDNDHQDEVRRKLGRDFTVVRPKPGQQTQ